MPLFKSKSGSGKEKEIRSMKDMAAELASFSEEIVEDEDRPAAADETDAADNNAEGSNDSEPRIIKSMSEAAELFAEGDSKAGDAPQKNTRKKRVYGDGSEHRTEEAERSPRAGKRHHKKKKRSLLLRLISPDKKIRRSNTPHPMTLFGYRLSFWPMFIALFVVLMVLVFLLNSTNLTVDTQPVTLMALSPDAEGYRMLVLSDHKTLTATRGHDRDPVPFFLYDSTAPKADGLSYTEANGQKGLFVENGADLMAFLFDQSTGKFL